MTRPRGRLGPQLLMGATAAATTWMAMNAWRELTVEPGGFLNPLLLLAAVVAGTGVATRWWRWPALGVLAAQLVMSGMVASLLITGSPVPVGGAWAELTAAVGDAIDSSRLYAAPVPTDAPPVDVLLILGGLACLLIVDLLACTLRQTALAGLPLLAVFSVPLGMVDESVAWWVFALTAVGFLTTLFLQESQQVERWGRPLATDRETGDPISPGAGAHVVRGTAGLVGGTATAVALLVPVLIPSTGVQIFDFGPGSGGGDDIQVSNPVADLVRDLKQGDDIPLLRVTTTDPDPSYLRILTLTRFSDAEWSPGDREVPSDHLADGQMPPPQGVAAEVSRREYPYSVTVLPEFDSRWLPTQPPVSRVDADGDWRYDDRTMDFIAGDDDLSTAALQYSMTAVRLDLSAQRLADSGTSTGKVNDIFTDLPGDLPPIVEDLATEVTQDATTPYEKAVALQDWFRSEFTYSLDRAEGNGLDALVDFLSEGPGGRIGYCEQFASAMAVMARSLGIPARVAIGFLEPTRDGPDDWTYSARDMHAWPELFFDGAGWVRFEPTPASRAENVPNYTVPGSDDDQRPSARPSAAASSSAPVGPSRPRDTESAAAAETDSDDGDAATAWGPAIGAVAGGLAAVALALLPRMVRGRRRERRLSSGAVEAVWAELRDTTRDLGIPWPHGRSPRETRGVLVEYLGAPVGPDTPERPAHGPATAPEAVAALDRLVLTLERSRYARGCVAPDPQRLRADGEACVAALFGGASRAARRAAAWWPRSVLTLRPTRRSAPGTVEARYGGVVDNMS